MVVDSMARRRSNSYINRIRAQLVLDWFNELFNKCLFPCISGPAKNDASVNFGFSPADIVDFIANDITMSDYYRTNKDYNGNPNIEHYVYKPCVSRSDKRRIYVKIKCTFDNNILVDTFITSFKPKDD